MIPTKNIWALIATLCLALGLHAQTTYYWIGSGGSWATAGNWSLSSGGSASTVAPGATDIAVFDANGGDCTLAANATIGEVVLGAGYANTLDLDGHSLIVAGGFTQHAGTFQGGSAAVGVGGTLHLIGGEYHATTGTTTVGADIIEEGEYLYPQGGKFLLTGTGAAIDIASFFYDIEIALGASAELVNNIAVAHNIHLDGPLVAGENTVFIGNSATSAITGTSGIYLSIGDGFGIVFWGIGENTGTYNVPLLATPTGPVAPMVMDIATAGEAGTGPYDGYIMFLCVELDDTKPQDLLGDGVGYYNATGGNNADMNINRIWGIVLNGYDVSPEFDLELSYTTADLNGISATEANLKAQLYDEEYWGELLGALDAGANNIVVSDLTLPVDGRASFTTLVDNTSPNKSTYGGHTGLTCADAINIDNEEPEQIIEMIGTEMWFKFTATDAIANIIALRDNDNPFYLEEMYIYTGGCGSLSGIGDTIVSPDTFILEKKLTGLTTSSEYYVKLTQPSGKKSKFRWPTSSPGELSLIPNIPIITGIRFVCQPNIRHVYTASIDDDPIYGSLRPAYRFNVTGGTIVSQKDENITIDWDDPDVGGEVGVSMYYAGLRPTTITVLVLVPCCRGVDGDIVVATTDVSHFITYSNGNSSTLTTTDEVVFNGTLTINADFTINNCPNIKFGPDAKVVVQSSRTLTISESVLKAGCNQMWEGIEVQAGGVLIIEGAEVWDAKTAVRSINGGAITLDHSDFINNYRGVHISGSSSGFFYPAIIDGCLFDGTGPLLAPHSTETGDFGLLGNDVSPFLIVGSNSFDQNEWLGFNTGITVRRTHASIENNRIHDLIGSGLVGVSVENPQVRALSYTVSIDNNIVEDCLNCIDVVGYRTIEVTDNDVTPVDNVGFGVRVSNQQQITTNCEGIVRINRNEIFNSRMGIITYNYTCIDHEIENNDIDNTSSDIDNVSYVQGITISSVSSYTPRPPYSFSTTTDVNFNDIFHTHTGIIVSARPLLAQISRNHIQVMLNLPGEEKYGTRLFQSHAATVSCNYIEPVENASTPSPSLPSRIPEIQGNYQNNSLLTQVLKNEIIQTGSACVMDGACDYSNINENNWIAGNLTSFALQNHGVVYQQGWSSTPRLNWFSTGGYATGTSLQNHLYTDGSDGRLSPFWLRGNNNDAYHPDPLTKSNIGLGSQNITTLIGANNGTLEACVLTLEIFDPEFNEPATMGILLDTIPFDDDSITYKWWAEWNTYYALGFFDSIANTDSIYIDFIDAYEANSVMAALEPLRLAVWEYNVDDAGPTDYENLLQDLSDITPTNTMEETTRDMARYVLKWKQGTLDGTDEDAIESIAELCAFYGGPGVLEARNFLSAFDMDLWHFDWEDGCTVPTPKRGTEEGNNIVEKNHKIYDLYPNPTTGNIQVVWSESGGRMEIYSLLGQKIMEHPLVAGDNDINLSTEHFGNGIFVVKFVIGSNTIGNKKLVISR